MSTSSNQLEEVQLENSSLPLETIVNTHILVEEGDSEAMGTVFWRNKQENIVSLRHMIAYSEDIAAEIYADRLGARKRASSDT